MTENHTVKCLLTDTNLLNSSNENIYSNISLGITFSNLFFFIWSPFKNCKLSFSNKKKTIMANYGPKCNWCIYYCLAIKIATFECLGSHTLSLLASTHCPLVTSKLNNGWSSCLLFSLHKAGAFKLLFLHCLVMLSNCSFLVSVLLCLIILLCACESKKEITRLASGEEDRASHHFSIIWSCPFSFLLNYGNNTFHC